MLAAGAMVRPARITAPISAPIVSVPSPIRYTPHTTIATVHIDCSSAVKLFTIAVMLRLFIEVRAVSAAARS